MTPFEEIKYKGCTIKLHYDEGYDSPDEWGDEGLFLVGYHRDFTVERDNIITKDQAVDIFRIQHGEELLKDADQSVKEILKEYHCFGLEAYIHSGVALSLSYEGNFPDRRWDVSQLGLVLAGKKEWKKREKARKAAEGLIETWNQYLSGEIYGYETESPSGEFIHSCWNYYDKDEMIEDAKGEINYYIKQQMQEHTERLKGYIKSSIPLVYRKPCSLSLK